MRRRVRRELELNGVVGFPSFEEVWTPKITEVLEQLIPVLDSAAKSAYELGEGFKEIGRWAQEVERSMMEELTPGEQIAFRVLRLCGWYSLEIFEVLEQMRVDRSGADGKET